MKKTLLILSAVVLLFAGCKKDTVFEEGEVLYSGSIRGYKYIDLGLPSGLKWAVCNVGASSPEDYGDYYAWGETETKSTYTSDNCSTCNLQMNDISGNSQYDVARKKWGSTWRIPTKSELEEIEDECTWTWTTQGDRNGYKVTGPNGNSIFLPAAGGFGGYWSSTPEGSNTDFAYHLLFSNSSHHVTWGARYIGNTVRPVSN